MSDQLLTLSGLDNGYGASQVLFGMALQVQRGQCVSLLGRNGMGKSTTIKSIMGLLPSWKGEVLWKGQPIHGQPPHRIAKAGIGLTPEGRQIFPNLSVRENLIATAIPRPEKSSPWTLQSVYKLFPRLQERASNFGNQLSGGEQQMLAIGRALMTNPELLILDEATEGLSPLVRQEIWSALALLRTQGMAILVIDKNIRPILALSDYHYIIEKGQVAWSGTSGQLESDPALRTRYLSA
ncbi:branched-chain amino acid transport system ATP-binding protein [Polaromonas sp. OV174]|uniref:ABC transporter ATP-binding protein n=1 Tax=Polaromonas sp. OV174 TaxID=1855300 RepID=UPI0008E05296|nr:ABC transporter ATP-binding protein [Polaromonas sp. OV174]SFC05974.1 branched-chain amino acid transport system ATP-binding protein [Polaromonas sp. OV174]